MRENEIRLQQITTSLHQEERINEVYMLAANRLIYASRDKK